MKLSDNFRFRLSSELEQLCETTEIYTATTVRRGRYNVSWSGGNVDFGYLEAMYAVEQGSWVLQ